MKRLTLRNLFLAGLMVALSVAFLHPSADAAKKKGGNLVVVIGEDPRTLDFHGSASTSEYTFLAHIGDGLTWVDNDGKVNPALATSWAKEGPRTWLFKLRKGVRFHDGTPFNAEAVRWNFARLLAQIKKKTRQFKAPRAKVLSMIDAKKTEVIDDYTVRIHTKYPFAPLLIHLAHTVGNMVSPTAVKKMGYKKYRWNPVGTGAFKFKEYRSGDHLKLVANKDYWGKRPYVDSLEFKFVTEDATRALMVRSGQAHYAIYISSVQAKALRADPNVKVGIHPLFRSMFFGLHNQKKPFDNVLVRRAMNYAIDKKTLIDKVLLGAGRPLTGPIHDTVWGYNPNLKGYDYNPEKAKALLKQAGYPNGIDIELWHSTGRYLQDKQIAEAVQGQLRKSNIRARLVTFDWGSWIPKIRAGKGQMWLLGWSNLTGDGDYALFFKFHSSNWGRPGNYTRYKNPCVDKLLMKGRTTFDKNERLKAYQQAQELIVKDAPWVFFKNEVLPTAQVKNLKGVVVHPGERILFHQAYFTK